jgi:PAS domain S-box-containing protein
MRSHRESGKKPRSAAPDEGQRLLEAALDEVADLVAICNAEGRLVFLNPAARGLALTEVSDVLDARVWGDWYGTDDRLISPEDWPLRRALAGERVEIEGYRVNPDGSRFWMLLSGAAIRDADGAILGAIATSKDITQRKRSEAETQAQNEELARRVGARTAAFERLQRDLAREVRHRLDAAELLERSRRMLQAILDHTAAVIYVKDTSFHYLLINAQFERIFAVRNAEVAGRSDYDLFPPEVVEPVRANDAHVLATGESLHCEEVVPQEDGLHTYVSLKFPLRGDDGSIYGVCGISTDITQRKAVEAELRRSQTTLSTVIESSGDAIFLVDRQGRLVVANSVGRQLFDELVRDASISPTALAAPATWKGLAGNWQALIERALQGEHFTLEELMPVGGSRRHLLLSLNPIREAGLVSGVTVFAKDITELRRAEEQASRHQAELAHLLRLHTVGEMAASLAHEINQPLGAIANYAQGSRMRLDAGTISAQELSHAMAEIAREALRAGEITRWVRALIRKDEPRRETADMNQIILAALAIVASSAHDRGVSLRFRPCDHLPPVEVDRIQIEQVILNLLLNALDAVEAGAEGRVEVRAVASGDHGVEVAVCDSGAGLQEEMLERVFEPFFTTKPNGLGMGLAISRAIIEGHDGRLSAAHNPSGGMVFSFVLPAPDNGDRHR